MRLEIQVDGPPVTVTTTRNAFLALGIDIGSPVIVRADPDGAASKLEPSAAAPAT